ADRCASDRSVATRDSGTIDDHAGDIAHDVDAGLVVNAGLVPGDNGAAVAELVCEDHHDNVASRDDASHNGPCHPGAHAIAHGRPPPPRRRLVRRIVSPVRSLALSALGTTAVVA